MIRPQKYFFNSEKFILCILNFLQFAEVTTQCYFCIHIVQKCYYHHMQQCHTAKSGDLITLLHSQLPVVANLVPMCFVIGVGYLDCNTATLAVIFITIQEAFVGALRSGSAVIRIDMAPRYSWQYNDNDHTITIVMILKDQL